MVSSSTSLTRTYPEPDEVGIGSVEEGLVANTAIRQVVEAMDGSGRNRLKGPEL